MVNCEKCGGKKNCSILGCKREDHYHCDCSVLRPAGSKSEKQKYESKRR